MFIIFFDINLNQLVNYSLTIRKFILFEIIPLYICVCECVCVRIYKEEDEEKIIII